MPGKEKGSEMPVPRRQVPPLKPEATRPRSSMLAIYGPDTQMQRNDDATGSLPALSSASVYVPGRTGRPTLPLSLSPVPLPPPTQVQVPPTRLLTRVRSRVPTQVLDLPTHIHIYSPSCRLFGVLFSLLWRMVFGVRVRQKKLSLPGISLHGRVYCFIFLSLYGYIFLHLSGILAGWIHG